LPSAPRRPRREERLLLLDGQVHHDTHAVPTGNYVIGAGNYRLWPTVTDFLDLSALAAGTPTFPSLPVLAAPGDTAAALACSTTRPGTIPPAGSVTSG
jgi:hypothetical protein